MASNFKYATAVKAAKLDATGLNAYIGASAKLDIYDGTQPVNPNTAITSQQKLAEFICNAGGFGSVSGGVLTAGAIGAGTGLVASTATWARLWKSDGTTPVFDCTVGTSGTDIIISNAAITVGESLTVSGLTITGGN